MHQLSAADRGRGQDLLGLGFVYQICCDLTWQQYLKICKTRAVTVGDNIPINSPVFEHVISR